MSFSSIDFTSFPFYISIMAILLLFSVEASLALILLQIVQDKSSKTPRIFYFSLVLLFTVIDGVAYIHMIKSQPHSTFGYEISILLPTIMFYAAFCIFIISFYMSISKSRFLFLSIKSFRFGSFAYLLMKIAYLLTYASLPAALNCGLNFILLIIKFMIESRISKKKSKKE